MNKAQSRRKAGTIRFEIIAILITVAGKFIFMDILNWRFPYVFTAILFWLVYIFYAYKKDKNVLKHWGFRKDNFNKGFRTILPYGVVAFGLCIIIGFIQQSIIISWHIIPILLLYPIWGCIQQFLLIALIAGNLKGIYPHNKYKFPIILITAILFALVHYPIIWLVIATFILALFYGFIYIRNNNLYVLGLFHGWLGAIFYYTILGDDPFLNVFGKYL